MYTKQIKKELSFNGIPLASGRHKIHRYPAMLHPHLVDYLIKKNAKKNDIIFDPFCGSGVTLLQSSIQQHVSIGFDINPLSLLIAKVKTASFEKEILEKEYISLTQDINDCTNTDVPDITNIDYWYQEKTIKDLGKIRFVLKHSTYKYLDFFVVCFAYICRNLSLTRKGEFKRYRIKQEKIKDIKNNVFETFNAHIKNCIDIFTSTPYCLSKTMLQLCNSEETINKKITYDLVITSPPYGDSPTTVAYGQYSSFGLDWIFDLNSLGHINYNIDKESIGGKAGDIDVKIKESSNLTITLEQISISNHQRMLDVLHFFNGYFRVLKNVINNLNKGGKVCFIVGNRTVGGIEIPMDQITADFLTILGLHFETILVRDILNKVMPSQNSPTNKVGITNKTMLYEYIVLFRK